jgi:hypothetical protein
MKLFDNEKMLKESENRLLLLTTHRIRQKRSRRGNHDTTSIMLEEISSIRLKYRSYPVLWFLAVISLAMAFVCFSQTSSNENGLICIAAGVFIILAFYITRRHYLSVSSSSAAIELIIEGTNSDEAEKIMDAIEHARNDISNLRRNQDLIEQL